MKQTRVFKVFISSTFIDFVAEREALQERVWPRLRAFCRAHDSEFQAVDLRWGINQEAALDQRTALICLEELGRCQRLSPRPSLIILLGDRYGWRPLPYQIPQPEFERIIAADPTLDTAGLLRWYRLDENAVPAAFVLQPRSGCYRDAAVWAREETLLRTCLEAGAVAAGIDPAVFRLSATHQEILAGTGASAPGDNWFGFFRTIANTNVETLTRAGYLDLTVAGARDGDATATIEALKANLRHASPDAVTDYNVGWTDHGPSTSDIALFCDMVESRLRASIESELARLAQIDPADFEIAVHRNFADGRRAVFFGRQAVLRRIADYAQTPVPPGRPLILYGEGGSGKSAIMAAGAAAIRDLLPHAVVIERYVGASPASSDAVQLAKGITDEIARALDLPLLPAHVSEDDILTAFAVRLTEGNADRPIVLFIDALDQLASAWLSNAMNWLPARIAPHCRLVLSVRAEQELVDYELRLHPDRLLLRVAVEGRPVVSDALAAKHRLDQLASSHLVEIGGLDRSHGDAALTQYLARSDRTLTDGQRRTVLDGFARHGLPLWLKLAADTAIRWSSWQTSEQLPVDVFGVIRASLSHLCEESSHGHELVATALGFLAASSAGLSEGELLDLLSLSPEVMTAFRRRAPDSPAVARLPTVVWSRLYSDLQPYLQERRVDHTLTYNFFHREFTEVVALLYLADPARAKFDRALADYFDDPNLQPVYLDQAAWMPNLRRLTQLPPSVLNDSDRLDALLDDLSFPIAMTAAGRFQELNRFYTLGAAFNPGRDGLREWRLFLSQYGHVLSRGDDGWSAHRVLLQRAAEHGNVSPVRLAVRPWLQAGHCDWHWLCSPVRSAFIGRTYCDRVYEVPRAAAGDQAGVALHAQAIDGSKTLVWSGDRNLYLWDNPWNPRGDRPLRLAGHRERQWGITINEAGGIEVLPGTALDDRKLGQFGLHYVAGGPEPSRAGVYGALDLGEGRIVTWCHDRVMVVSDLLSGEALARLEGHTDWVRGALDLDGRRFVSWGDDGTLRVWNSDTLKCLSVVHAHDGWIMQAHMPPGTELLLTRDDAQTVRAWSVTDWTLRGVVEHVPAGWDAVAVTASGHLALKAVEAHDPALDWTKETRGQPAAGMVMLDRRRCAFLHADGRFEVWDSWARHWLNDCVGHRATVVGLQCDKPEAERFLTWSEDGTVRRWQMEAVDEDWPYEYISDEGRRSRPTEEIAAIAATRQQERLQRHRKAARHHGPIRGVARIAGGEFASWADDGDVRVWQMTKGASRLCIPAHAGPVAGAFSASAGCIATWSHDGQARIFDLTDGRPLGTLSLDNANFGNVIPLGDGLIVVAVTRESIRLWDLGAVRELAVFCEELGPVRVDAARLLAGEYVLCWSLNDEDEPYALNLWCIEDGRRHASFDGAVADGADHMFLWSDAGPLVYWDLANALEIGRVKDFGGASIASVLVLAPGKLLIRRVSGLLTLWAVDGGEPRDVPLLGRSPIQRIDRIDDQWLMAFDDADHLMLWDAATMTCVGQAPARSYAVRQLLPLGGRQFLSVELNGRLRHLDFETGQAEDIPLPTGHRIEQAVFLDGDRVLLRELDGAIWLWCPGEIGEGLPPEPIIDARLRPYRAKCRGPVAGTDNLFALSFNHAVGLYRIDAGEVTTAAEWVSDQAGIASGASVTIHAVETNGTMLVEVASGELLPLKLFQGNSRINLADFGTTLDTLEFREDYA